MTVPLDGAVFLARVRETAPETARILLAGQADLDSAIAAVNEGNIFTVSVQAVSSGPAAAIPRGSRRTVPVDHLTSDSEFDPSRPSDRNCFRHPTPDGPRMR